MNYPGYSMSEEKEPSTEDISEEHKSLLIKKIESLRKRLLDTSRRNPLISVNLSTRSNSVVRVVDELPDVLLSKLTDSQNPQAMRIVPLPDNNSNPLDENTSEFSSALSTANFRTMNFYKL